MEVGTDIIEISRIEQVLERQGKRFIERILTASEQQLFEQRGNPVRFLANRFAAKEATAKALGTGIARGISFQMIEVLPNEFGAPTLKLFEEARKKMHLLGCSNAKISLSDEKHYCVATAILY